MMFYSFAAAVGAAIAYCLYLTFMVVPNEQFMGAVQRVFYFHVPAAFAAYLALFVLFFGSVGYLATSKRSFDALQEAGAEVSFLFGSIMLFTGMIWGNAAWGTPFTFEPRLVSSLLMWLILLGLNLMRWFGDSPRLATHCAALGILGALTIPVVIYSIKLLPQFQQLHPQVVSKGGLSDPLMQQAFYWCSLSVMALAVLLIWIRYRIATADQNYRASSRR